MKIRALAAVAGAGLALCASVAAAAALTVGSVTLVAPEGWRTAAAAPDGSVASLIGPDGQTTVLVTAKPATAQEVTAQLSERIDLGRGIVLTPIGRPKADGAAMMGDFSVVGAARPARGVVLVRQANGQALALVGVAPDGKQEPLRQAERQMLASARMASPPPAGAGPGSSGWAAYLKGRYLAKFYSGSGYHEKQEMWLCSDGSYRIASDGGGFTAGVASGAFQGGSVGTWSATGATTGVGAITLRGDNGSTGQLNVRMGNDGLYLNGQRWMRGDNTRCR